MPVRLWGEPNPAPPATPVPFAVRAVLGELSSPIELVPRLRIRAARRTGDRPPEARVSCPRRVTYDAAVTYWTDIFTLETWAQARARGFRITGFPPPTPGSGGYSPSMFARIRPGDVFLCYCKRPAGRWVGALRVTSEAFQSDDPVWGLDSTGAVRYPWRFEAEPIVTWEPSRGLEGRATAERLNFLARLGRAWGTFLQRSLNRIPDEDGDVLLALLNEPRDPVPIRAPAARQDSVAEPSLLDVRAEVPPPAAVEAPATAEEAPEDEALVRVHTEMQGMLRDIGFQEGYDVWVADRGVAWRGGFLGDGCLDDLPVVAPERTRAVMRNIDVIWFRAGTGIPDRFYEVEQSTQVFPGLLRFNDVMVDYRIERAFIVGGDERTQRKFEREVRRRTFEASGLSEVTRFLHYEGIRELWESYQRLGPGSASWG